MRIAIFTTLLMLGHVLSVPLKSHEIKNEMAEEGTKVHRFKMTR
jgi:hypothetical protein